jgi:hypothetical protein
MEIASNLLQACLRQTVPLASADTLTRQSMNTEAKLEVVSEIKMNCVESQQLHNTFTQQTGRAKMPLHKDSAI